MAPGQSVEYFRYGYANGANIKEETAIETNYWGTFYTTRPPRAYYFSNTPGPDQTSRGICPFSSFLQDAAKPLYWNIPLLTTLATNANLPPNQRAYPSMFHSGPGESGTKGLQWSGAFSQDAPILGGTSALEVAYMTDRRCTDGGVEFGFYKQFSVNAFGGPGIAFYYSDYTNCTTAFCFRDPMYTQATGDKVDTLRISNLPPNTAFTFQAYLVQQSWWQWKFRVEVLNKWTGQYVQCSFNSGWSQTCSYDMPINPSILSYPGQKITNATMYAQVGIQQIGFTSVPINEAFWVDTVKVGK